MRQNEIFDVTHMCGICNFNLAIPISMMAYMRHIHYQMTGVIQFSILRIQPQNNRIPLQFYINQIMIVQLKTHI